jgi:hypothetical protein
VVASATPISRASPRSEAKPRDDNDPRILFVDIETSPALAAVWGTGNQYVSANQIRRRTRMQCLAWMRRGNSLAKFAAEWQDGGRAKMLSRIHAELDAADLIVHYNGQSFDVTHLNREFVEAGLTPPSPYAQVDLYRAVKRRMRFDSHKLGFISDALEVGSKRREDMSLWNALDSGDTKERARARREMARYNRQDVVLLEELYDKLLPWIDGHPNMGLHAGDGRPCCPACGSSRQERRGVYRTKTGIFPRFQCQICGRWSRGASRESTTPLREAT